PLKAEKMPKANFWMTMGFFITLGVTWLMYMNWESNLSVYMVSLGIPFHLYSTLWTINAGIIVVVQLILARFPRIFKSIYLQIYFGIFMFAVSWLTLIFAKTYPGFVLSMSILTLGESTAFSAIPAYVNDMSPYSSKGKYQGMTLVASGVGRAFGPLFGGTLIDLFGYEIMFVVASCGILLCLLALLPLRAKLKDQVQFFK
ncbi:MAG: MFS transporter, partial [Lactobacillus delbrueckii]